MEERFILPHYESPTNLQDPLYIRSSSTACFAASGPDSREDIGKRKFKQTSGTPLSTFGSTIE